MSKKKKRLIVLTALWICVIWGHSLMNGETSTAESGRLYALIMSLIPEWFTVIVLRKLGHFSEYFILGILLKLDFDAFIKLGQNEQFNSKNIIGDKAGSACNIILEKSREIFAPAVMAWIIAFLDETIQLFVPERAGMIADVWIDFSGAFLAIILTYVMIILRDKKRHN